MLRTGRYASAVTNGTNDLTKATIPSRSERSQPSHPRLLGRAGATDTTTLAGPAAVGASTTIWVSATGAPGAPAGSASSPRTTVTPLGVVPFICLLQFRL